VEECLTMNVKENIGILNSLIRITCGLTILAWSTSKLVKRPWRDSYLIMAMIGAMKVAEGIVRYCPITDLFERIQEKQTKEVEGDLTEVNEVLPYNPS
jgi:hypothetical protein